MHLNKISLLLFLLVFAASVEAQTLRALTVSGSKYGFIDYYGNTVIEAVYDDALSFSENLAPVMLNGKWGFINRRGEVVVDYQYDSAIWFWEGLAAVSKGEKWGYIDKTGTVVIPFEYDDTFAFSEGLAAASKDGFYGYIDKAGKEVIPFIYGETFDFYKGIGPANDSLGRIVFIDRNGEKVSRPYLNQLIIHKADYIRFYSDNEKIGVRNKRGKILIKPKFDALSQFQYKRAFYKIGDGKYGLVKAKGKVLSREIYEDVGVFAEDYAAVKIDGLWGYIHKKRGLSITPKFKQAERFHNGLAAVYNGKKWGYINTEGKLVIDFIFNHSGDMEFN